MTVTLLYTIAGHAHQMSKQVDAKVCEKAPGSVVVAKLNQTGCEDVTLNELRTSKEGVPQPKFRKQVEPFCNPNDDGSSVIGVICLK
jgi:hypothetical protein